MSSRTEVATHHHSPYSWHQVGVFWTKISGHGLINQLKSAVPWPGNYLVCYNTFIWEAKTCMTQATVLLVVPYETQEEDVAVSAYNVELYTIGWAFILQVVIEKSYLLAGVRGQQPIVKVYVAAEPSNFIPNHVCLNCNHRVSCTDMWTPSTLPGNLNPEPHDFPHENELHPRYPRHPRNHLTRLYLTLIYLVALLHQLEVPKRQTPMSSWPSHQHFHHLFPLHPKNIPILHYLDGQRLHLLVLYRPDVHRAVSHPPFLPSIRCTLLILAGC
jgi:hypothetical protein